MSIIYDRVIALCKENNINKTILERECGFSQNSINKWNTRSFPAADKLMKVADYFGVSVDYLLGRETSSLPIERQKNDIPSVTELENLLKKGNGLNYIEKLCTTLNQQQQIYVISWIIGYMAREGLPVSDILKNNY